MRLKEAVSAAGLSAILAVSSGCADQQRKPAQITDGQTRVEATLPDHVAFVEYKIDKSSTSKLQRNEAGTPDTITARWVPQGQESILYLDEGGRLGLKNKSRRKPLFIQDGIKNIAKYCGINGSNADFFLTITDEEYFDKDEKPMITNVVKSEDGRVREVQVSAVFARNEAIQRHKIRSSSESAISRFAGIVATEEIVGELCNIGGKTDAKFRAGTYARGVINGDQLPAITILSPGAPRG